MRHIPLLFVTSLLVIPSAAEAAHKETHMVTMRDGTRLATNIYIPDGPAALPTVLIRTPYGKGTIDQPYVDLIVDTLGFTLVMQDTRGQGDSEGLDQVFYTDGWGDAQDGYDTVEWIANQPWTDGNVGEMGASAMGIAAQLNGGAGHPALKALHIGIAPTDFYHHAAYQGGSFRESLIIDWLEGQDASYMIDTYKDHPYDDEFWAELDIRERFAESVRLPVYYYGGFHDVFAEGTLSGFETMQPLYESGEAGQQRLLMGPWTHLDAGAFSTRQGELEYPTTSIIPIGDASPFNWFNQWLKGTHRPLRDAHPYPARIYLMGDVDNPNTHGNRWAWAKDWPVDATTRRMYLRADGSLTTTESNGGEAPLMWQADPQNPSPTLGGRNLSLPAGPRDQSPLQGRDDVLFFETEPLEEAVTVVGPITAQLFVNSLAPDTDVSVRLADGYPDGRSMLVTDGIRRLRTRLGYTEAKETFLTASQLVQVEVEVGSTAQVFDKGHRIQVYVSSSNHRRFKVAGNTALPYWEEGEGQVATNQLWVDESFGSHILLPIPKRGALKHLPTGPRLTRADEARALDLYEAGEALSDVEFDALRQAADRLLFELTWGAATEVFR